MPMCACTGGGERRGGEGNCSVESHRRRWETVVFQNQRVLRMAERHVKRGEGSSNTTMNTVVTGREGEKSRKQRERERQSSSGRPSPRIAAVLEGSICCAWFLACLSSPPPSFTHSSVPSPTRNALLAEQGFKRGGLLFSPHLPPSPLFPFPASSEESKKKSCF